MYFYENIVKFNLLKYRKDDKWIFLVFFLKFAVDFKGGKYELNGQQNVIIKYLTFTELCRELLIKSLVVRYKSCMGI